MKPSRLEAFSDGVFAVAITLLVFNLKVPDVAGGHLRNAILDRIAMADRELLFINLALLLGIVSIPFTTSLAATWYNQGTNAKWAIGIYCANWVYVSATYILLIRHLMGHEHLATHATGVTLQSLLRKGLFGIVAYLVALVVSLIAPIVAFFICLALAVYFVFGVQGEAMAEH